jgi:hypothetical protein
VSSSEEVDRWAEFEDVGNSLAYEEDMVGEESGSEACTTLSIRVVVEPDIHSSLLRSCSLVDLSIGVGYCLKENDLPLDLGSHVLGHDLVPQTHEHSSVGQSAQRGRRTVVVHWKVAGEAEEEMKTPESP